MNIEGAAPSTTLVDSNSVVVKKMADGQIDVYYALPSMFCRSTIMLAKALNVQLNLKPINLFEGEHMTPEFIKMNPQHTIPTMVEDDFIIWESRAIMQYFVDKFDTDKKFVPETPQAAALVNQRIYFEACTLSPRLVDYFVPLIMHNQEPDASKKIQYEESLSLLDGLLTSGSWIAGDKISIADFCYVVNISTAECIGIDISTYSNISDWYEKCKDAMSDYGYKDVNQAGVDMFSGLFNEKMKQLS